MFGSGKWGTRVYKTLFQFVIVQLVTDYFNDTKLRGGGMKCAVVVIRSSSGNVCNSGISSRSSSSSSSSTDNLFIYCF